jgi:5-methylcytosine-specific restriction endonuclease McrA
MSQFRLKCDVPRAKIDDLPAKWQPNSGMKCSDERLNDIFDRTDGRCHLCGKRLAFCNFAKFGLRGAWEVEHSVPRARGGTNRLNNLYAACITCNRSKGTRRTRSVRAEWGYTRAPLSVRKKEELLQENILTGGLLGCIVGQVVDGRNQLTGALIGILAGIALSPE